ncbi:hypothetical protein [Bacillus coahuilensis]|uniref:hypothetical protein n=1 Tax=Bacillus coahuilensis TaxID=408580 RepID=UPI0001850925|nr:hypothetical protein [Bacillus coahuilensis]
MFTESEVYIAVGVVISLIVLLLSPTVRVYLNKFYNFLVAKLGKQTADALKSVFLAALKFLPVVLDRLIKSKKLGKVDKKDVEDIKKGYKKGKDILK